MAQFTPRTAFPPLLNLPRSYFLGHHSKALQDMNKLLSSTDLLLEVRDYRIPLSSINPLLEEKLSGRNRVVVYMKRDLGCYDTKMDLARDEDIREWHYPTPVHFITGHAGTVRRRATRTLLRNVKEFVEGRNSLTPSTLMLVGMPNVGKSTLLNALRSQGMGFHMKRAARVGDMPGVTRSISHTVKLVKGETESSTIYIRDTPGVFVPYVQDPETMLRLALCGCVKDSVISPVTLADYALYRINLVDPELYGQDHEPTNDVLQLLHFLAKKLGRLKPGGRPDVDAAAIWFVKAWRDGKRGKFPLDEVSMEALSTYKAETEKGAISISQAKKMFISDSKAAKQQKRIANVY